MSLLRSVDTHNVTRPKRKFGVLGQSCRVARLRFARLHDATSTIYFTILLHGYPGELFYGCSMTCSSIIEGPRRDTTSSSCLRLLLSTFCFPKPLSSSVFPLPPAEALHQFSHPSTARCHGSLPRFTLSTASDMSCIPMYLRKKSHTGSVGSFWDSWASLEISLGSFSRCVNYEPKSSKIGELGMDLLLIR